MTNDELIVQINQLRRERNAIILAHNYQLGEIQDIADFCGDSLELARKAAQVRTADVIVFCGVHFMAETAAILSPTKTVVMPDEHAGCPMADMITAAQLREFKAKHPGAAVVCYVNSSAEVKAECDACCTSANAANVVASFPQDQPIIFVPDQYLGAYVERQTGRKLILWPGYCPTHQRTTPGEIAALRLQHPGAKTICHPECNLPIQDACDFVASTGGMIKIAGTAGLDEFIVVTEKGMIHRLQTQYPGKKFHHIGDRCTCPNMKKNTLEKVWWCLRDLKPTVTVPPEIAAKANKAILRMLEIVA
jgi:quinolinate synthase